MRKLLKSAGMGMALSAMAMLTTRAEAASLNLRVSTGFPSVHGIVTEIARPWFEKLKEESGVDVKATFFTAGSSLGALDQQLDQVQRGIVDAALGLSVVPRGRMPRTQLGDIPFITPSRDALTSALNSLSGTSLSPDFKGLKLVAIMVDCSSLHTVNRPVEKLADLKGLRLRVPSALGAAMVEAVGGIPVSMPQSDIYESLERNVIDGAITPWDIMKTLNLAEVLKYHTVNPLFCGQLWFAFNEKKYSSYPEAVRKAIDALSGEAMVSTLHDIYAGWDKMGEDFAKEKGGRMYELSAQDMAAWKAATQPAVDAFIKSTKAAGVGDIYEIKSALDAAIAKGASVQ